MKRFYLCFLFLFCNYHAVSCLQPSSVLSPTRRVKYSSPSRSRDGTLAYLHPSFPSRSATCLFLSPSSTISEANNERQKQRRQQQQQRDGDDSSSSTTPGSSSSNTASKQTRCVNGVSSRAGPLNEAVAQIAGLDSFEEANDLISIGAVWARMEGLTEEDLLSQYDDASSSGGNSRAMYADLQNYYNADGEQEEEDLDKYIEKMETQRFRRILTPSWIEAGTDIRLYPNPRRFPSCYDMNRDSLIYEDTTFVVVDKPPMLPTQPDASNYYECCPGCAQEMLGPFVDIRGDVVSRPLICHRVDSCVGGCVVLSKDRNGQKVFLELQRKRKLRKLYLAVTTKPVPLGMHLHWMWAPQSARGKSGGPLCQLVSHTPPESRRKARQFWKRCILEVVKCDPIDIVAANEHGYDPAGKQHYQSTIRLVTGRKHQVRAQLASLGCPIILDTMYEPMSGLTLDRLESSEADMDSALASCRVPDRPIGLQAHAILFGGIRAKAGVPWWGDGTASSSS